MATTAPKTLNAKQKILKENAEQRSNAQRLAFAWQEKIFSKPKVSFHLLQQAAAVLQPKTYDEIIEERAVQDWCGYPLCDRRPLKDQPRYKISLSQRKVYDQSELFSFCSEDCLQKSKYFRMQLSEEPVWIRDPQRTPDIHIVLPSQNLQKALSKEKERTSKGKTGQQIRQDYVQQLLANVPTMANQSDQDLRIIEREGHTEPTVLPIQGVHDSIEGYRIHASKDRNQPTTMILKLKEAQKEEEETLDINDEEAVFEDAMGTMMRLRNMQIGDTKPTAAAANIEPAVQPPSKGPIATVVNSTASVARGAAATERNAAAPPKSMTPAHERKVEAKNVTMVIPDQNRIAAEKKKKKKKAQPEMSLFGKIWTITDRITTRATRRYFQQLEEMEHVSLRELLKDEEAKDDTAYMRSQIFSERILEAYALLRAQLGLQHALENDLINLIQTFRFSDASIVVLDSLQAYMMTLVLFKALADITIREKGWHPKFDECCHSIGESRDTIDACVRVLKIAST